MPWGHVYQWAGSLPCKDSALGHGTWGFLCLRLSPFPGQADSAWPSHLTSIPVLGQTYPVALISCPTCLLRAVQFSGASGQSSGFQPGDVWPCLDILNCHNSGEGAVGMYTLLYSKWSSKDRLCSTGNSAQCYVAAWMAEEFVGDWRHACLWLSFFAVHLKLSQRCLSVILQYRVKSLKKHKNQKNHQFLL